MPDDTPLATFDIADLTDDTPRAVKVGDSNAVLVRHGGKVCVLGGTCTHLQAPLADGLVVDGEIRCPWHHARFSLDTGEAIGGPAFAPIKVYEVDEADGQAHVRLERPDGGRATRRDIGRVVVVGGGGAGYACADQFARRGAGGSVTMLSEDADAPYDRTFCSKQYLSGEKSRDDAALPTTGQGLGDPVTVRTGVRVTAIDPYDGAVTLNGGERIAFDTLVLATGAAPTVPDFTGAERDDVLTLRTLADADALIAAAEDASAVLVIGASYIALEVAASLTKRGLAVTVVAEGEVPLEQTAGAEIGGMVRGLHEGHGVTFRMGCTVRSWDGERATLDDGSVVSADFIVAGTGVVPRVELAKAAGLALAGEDAGGGVKVDATLRTSHPRVYAIGDIANVPDPRLGHPIRVEHWVVAQRMGQWLARHLLGEVEGGYGEVPFFWSGHYDTQLRYVGHVASPDDRRIDGDIAVQDAAVTYCEGGEEQAVLTCGRDLRALEVEAAWTR